jgi:hypothetical protein
MVNVRRHQGDIYRISTPVFNNIMSRVLTKFSVPAIHHAADRLDSYLRS